MKAAIYYGVKDIRIEEIPTPVCGDDDVLVKSVRTGICGSDTGSYFLGGHVGGNAPGRQIGHEMVGHIVEVGKNTTGMKVGDRVFVNPMKSMPLGESDMMGGFSEYVRVPNAKVDYNVYLLPDSLSYDEAVLIEPFAVGTRGKNRPGAKKGDHVIVYGVGTIGLCCIAALIAQGIVPIAVVRSNKRRELLEKMGAIVCNIKEVDLFEFVKEHFGMATARVGYPIPDVDIVVDCAGAPNIPDDFVRMAKSGSRLSIVAIAKEPRMIPPRLMSTEGFIHGSCCYDHEDLVEVIDNLTSRRTCINDIVTHHFKLEDINEAMAVANARETAIKVVIDME
jgi:2-desacetyl-2-hydroxyethyl bacteriochlorophyllide A dehydrogenase